jgi:hypothetical protein
MVDRGNNQLVPSVFVFLFLKSNLGKVTVTVINCPEKVDYFLVEWGLILLHVSLSLVNLHDKFIA